MRTHPLIPSQGLDEAFVQNAPSGAQAGRNLANDTRLPFSMSSTSSPPENLIPEKRIACMSQTGVNFLLQRWVHHNSRMVVLTWQYQQTSSGAYEEADLIEECCEERMEAGLAAAKAAFEAMEWLCEDLDGVPTRQKTA
jgi:hypothetical protein